MTHAEIVRKLIGKIRPVGDTHEDEERFHNLQNMITLVDHLIGDIEAVSTNADHEEGSRKNAGLLAKGFLNDLYDTLPNTK